MENQTPKSIASATSTVRGHSPYCEATGPIVHEGFVAARVRAIQAKFDGTSQKLSHSPLIPCPVPHWLQITDPLMPPQSLSSGRHKSGQKHTMNTGSAGVRSRPFDPESGTVTSTVAPGETNDATNGSSVGTRFKDEKIISSPKPTMPITARPYDEWPYSYREESFQNTDAGSGIPLRPLNSVAAKLGSMVDRGWVGCDVFGKAYSDRRTSDIYASSEYSQQAISSERYPKWELPHEQSLPVRRRLYPEKNNSVHHQDPAAQAREFRTSQDINVEPLGHGHRRQRGSRTRSESDGKAHARIDSSAFDRSQVSDTENCKPSKPSQAKTRRHYRHFMDCQSQRSDYDNLSLSQEIDRHVSHWENTRGVSHEHPGLAEPVSTNMEVDDHVRTPQVASNKEDGCRATTTSQQPNEPLVRSASWFSKLAGFKLVLIDKAPIMQALSRRISEPAIGSVGVQHHYKHQHEIKRQPAILADKIEICGNEALFTNSEPINFLPKTIAPKSQPNTTRKKDNTMGVLPTTKSAHLPGSTPYQDVPHTSDSLSHSSQLTLPSLSSTHDVQEHDPGRIGDKKPAQSISTPEDHKEELIHTSHNASTSRLAQTLRDMKSESSNSKHATRKNVTEVDGSQAPEFVLPKVKPAATARLIEGEAKDTKKSAQWEVAGNGRGIKRVQVIVSLDGADDLIIDAKLLTTPEKGNESRIEEVEILDSEKLSEGSCEDFF